MTIKGSISRMFPEYEMTYEDLVTLIGKPILDTNRNQIGVIDNIDILADTWVGHLCDGSIPDFLNKKFNTSFEIVKGE